MNEKTLRELLESIRAGQVGIDQAIQSLRQLPFRDLLRHESASIHVRLY